MLFRSLLGTLVKVKSICLIAVGALIKVEAICFVTVSALIKVQPVGIIFIDGSADATGFSKFVLDTMY